MGFNSGFKGLIWIFKKSIFTLWTSHSESSGVKRRIPAIHCGIPQSLQENAGIEPLSYSQLLHDQSIFIIYYHTTGLYDPEPLTASLNKPQINSRNKNKFSDKVFFQFCMRVKLNGIHPN